MSQNIRGEKDTISKTKAQGRKRSNSKHKIPVAQPALLKEALAHAGYQEQVAESLDGEHNKVDAQQAMIATVEAMFDLFQNLAYESNEKHSGSDLELTWIRPSLVKEPAHPWHEQKALISVFTGKISTRKCTMIVRGAEDCLKTFIFPADKLISFALNPPNFKPYCQIEARSQGVGVEWLIDEKRLSSDDLDSVFRELFNALLRFSREEAPLNEVFATRSSGLHDWANSITVTAASTNGVSQARSFQEEFLADMKEEGKLGSHSPLPNHGDKKVLANNEATCLKANNSETSATNSAGGLPTKDYLKKTHEVAVQLYSTSLNYKQEKEQAASEPKIFDGLVALPLEVNPLSNLTMPHPINSSMRLSEQSRGKCDDFSSKGEDKSNDGWKPINESVSTGSSTVIPFLSKSQPLTPHAPLPGDTVNKFEKLPAIDELKIPGQAMPPLTNAGKKAFDEHVALLAEVPFNQRTSEIKEVSCESKPDDTDGALPGTVFQQSFPKAGVGVTTNDCKEPSIPVPSSFITTPQVTENLKPTTFSEVIKMLVAVIDRELEVTSRQGSEAFSRRDLTQAELSLKKSAKLSEFRQVALSLLQEYP